MQNLTCMYLTAQRNTNNHPLYEMKSKLDTKIIQVIDMKIKKDKILVKGIAETIWVVFIMERKLQKESMVVGDFSVYVM